MPNYVMNKVTIKNISEKELTELLVKFKNDQQLANELTCTVEELNAMSKEDLEDAVREHPTLDFNKVYPMPEELNITSGSDTNTGMGWWIYNNRRELPPEERLNPELSDEDYDHVKGICETSTFMSIIDPSTGEINPKYIDPSEEIKKLGIQAVNNIINYGAPTWYEWRRLNWGTKWNSCDPGYSDDPHVIKYTTAWSPAYGVIEELSRSYPEVKFSIVGADEGFPQTFEFVTFQDGEVVASYDIAPTSEESVWADIWGYDDDDLAELKRDIFGDDEDEA